MWRSFFFTIYFLPNIYIYIRLRRFFIRGRHKLIFTLLFCILVLAFPVSELLSHRSGAWWTDNILTVGYYALPFLLYLFMALLLFDLLLIINWLLKIISPESTRSRIFRVTSLVILFLLPLVIVIAGRVHYNNIKINKYHIAIQRKSSAITHLRIALAGDFHLREQTSKYFMKDFTTLMNSTNPDIVLIPGDVLEGDRENEATLEYEQQFRNIKSKYGVYAAFGNHEYHRGNSRLKFFSNAHINILQDAAVKIDQAFYIIGRNDNHSSSRKSLDDLLQLTNENLPIILLDHRPSDIDQVSQSKVDIQISGHTHNGQLFPFNYVAQHIYKLSWGHKKIGNTDFFVTSGVQGWGPMIRTAGDSEIMVIDIDFA